MGFVITKKSGFQKQCLEKTTKVRRKHAGQVDVKAASAGSLSNDLTPALEISWRKVAELKSGKRRVRKTTEEHVAATARSIRHFGFISPITIRGDVVVDGLTRLKAAAELGIAEVPCVDISHLGEAESRMVAISLNRLGETGVWDFPELKLELTNLAIDEFDLTLSG